MNTTKKITPNITSPSNLTQPKHPQCKKQCEGPYVQYCNKYNLAVLIHKCGTHVWTTPGERYSKLLKIRSQHLYSEGLLDAETPGKASIEYNKPHFQGLLDNLFGLKTLSDGITTASGAVTNTIENSNSIFRQFVDAASPLLESFNKTMTSVNSGFSSATLLGLAAMLFALWRVRKDKIAFISILISHGVMAMGTPLYEFIVNKLESFTKPVFQFAGAETVLDFDKTVGQILKYFPIFSTISLVFMAPFLKAGPVNFNNYFSLMSTMAIEKAGSIGKATQGLGFFYNTMTSLTTSAMDMILQTCCGVTKLDQEEHFNSSVKTLLTDLESLQDYKMQHEALLDNKILDKVQAVYSRAYELCRTFDHLKNTSSWDILRTILDKSKQLHAKLVDICGVKDKQRTAPLAVLIQGETGIGKSFLTDYIIKLLAKYHNKLVSDNQIEGKLYDLQDLGDLKYSFNPMNEFYDGYKQQFSVVLDDFGQRKDSEANPNPEYAEIIQIVNEAQYVVHSAHLADKGKIYMRSNFVLASTNHLKQNIKSITYPKALYRRFKAIARFRVKPQFALPNGSLNIPSLLGKIRTDIYDIDLYDTDSLTNINQQPVVQRTISFDQYIQALCLLYKDIFSSSKNYTKFMADEANFNIEIDENAIRNLPMFQMAEDDSSSLSSTDTLHSVEDGDLIYEEEVTSVGEIVTTFQTELLEDIQKKIPVEPILSFSWLKQHFTNFNMCTNFKYYKDQIISNWKTIVGIVCGFIGTLSMFYKFGKVVTTCRGCKEFERFKTDKHAYLYYYHIMKRKYNTCEVCKNVATLDPSTPVNELLTEIERLRKVESDVDFEYLQDEVAYNNVEKYVKNTLNITGMTDDNLTLGSIIMMKGVIGLTNAHNLTAISKNETFRVAAFNGVPQTIKVSDCKMIFAPNTDNTFNDYALVVFPPSMRAFPDITKHLCKQADLHHFKQTQGYIVRHNRFTRMIESGMCYATDVPMSLESDGKVHMLRDRYEYKIPTTRGHCGSLLVAENTKLPNKIIGIHSFGDAVGNNAAVCITFERVNNLLSQIPPTFQIAVPELPSVTLDDTTLAHQGSVIENVHNIGTLKHHIPLPTKTKLTPSPMYNKILDAPALCKPAKLFDPTNDPLTLGLKKVANMPESVDLDLLEQCADHYFKSEFVYSNSGARVLTYQEGVEGNSSLGVVPLCRSTSPGFPYIMQRKKPALGGKKEWFGSNQDYLLDEGVEKSINERIRLAKLGQRTETLWIDTLKDERRPVEKVDQNKTRVFSVGPQDYIIATRMYFGAFVGHIMKNRIKNEVCVGINVYSSEWTRLVQRLREVGNKCIAGDFSNFDGSLLVEILRKICEKINVWYGDDNSLVRTVLFEEICNGIHVCRNHVYGWTHSQPSGNPLTVIINSIFNSIIMRMAFVKLGGSLMDYDKHVRMVNYGDDNLFSVSDNYITTFNQITITQTLASMGLTYTDEGKSGELIAHRSLDEVSFLKRGFRRLSGGLYRAPLALNTITEMCQWLRSSADPIGDCKSNVEQALFELSLHDQQVWTKWNTRIVDAARKSGIHITSYSQLDIYNDRIRTYLDTVEDDAKLHFQCKDDTSSRVTLATTPQIMSTDVASLSNSGNDGSNPDFQSEEKELLPKDCLGKEQILPISRVIATPMRSEDTYLSGCSSVAALPQTSCSPTGNVAAFSCSQISANNNHINTNRNFKSLTEGTKIKQLYNEDTKTCILLVVNSTRAIYRKTRQGVEKSDARKCLKDLRMRYEKRLENAAHPRPPKRNQRDKKTFLPGTISGDDKTTKIINRVILESNFEDSSPSLPPTQNSLYYGLLKSIASYYVQMNLPPIVNGVWRSSLAGFVMNSLPAMVEIDGVLRPKETILQMMQEGKLEPWDDRLDGYLSRNMKVGLQYAFYIGTAFIEEGLISSENKLLFGFKEFFIRMQQDSSRIGDYLPAFFMHLATTVLGRFSYGWLLRFLCHALFNAFTVMNRNIAPGTLEDSNPDNSALMATEEGKVSSTAGDADMTQLTQDQDTITDSTIQTTTLTTAKNDLAQTLQRKIYIGKFSLSEIDQPLTPKVNDVFPKKMFDASKFLQARLQNYRYIRGSIKFTIMINATKFDVGQIYFMWVPNGAIESTGTYDDYHWRSLRGVTAAVGVPIKVGPGAVGELTVPCLIPYKGYDMHADMFNYGVLKAFILNPLISGSSKPIQCTYYAQFCDDVQVEVAMPLQEDLRHQQGTAKDYAPGCHSGVVEPGTLSESIAGALDVATSIGSALVGGIPVVGEVVGSIGKVMSLFGWAKPINVDVVHQFAQAPAKEFNHARGMDNSTVLGLDSQNCSNITATYSYRPYDEMSFTYLFKQKCLMHTEKWNFNSPDILHVHQVKPWSPLITTDASVDLELADVDYIGFIANMFDLWTGEIELTVEILNHMAQSGRIRVGIFPPISDAVANTLTLEDFDNVPNEILDIQANQSTLTFSAPYLLPTAWSNINTPGCTVVIAVMNELVCQDGTPDTAYINIWRKGTDTLQFTSPNQQTDFVPQFREPNPVTPPKLNAGFSATAEFQYFDEKNDAITFHEFQTPAGVADASVDTFKSVKDLINRPSLMLINKTNKDTAFSTNENLFGNLAISSSSTDLFRYNSDRPSMLEYFSRLYAFCRGSINEKAVAQTPDGVVYSNVATVPVTSDSSVTPNSFYTAYLGFSSKDYECMRFTALHPLAINPIAEVNIPQFSHTPMRAVQYVGHTDDRIPLGGALAKSTEIRHFQWIFPAQNKGQICIYRGGGDDFQFLAPYGVPRLSRST